MTRNYRISVIPGGAVVDARLKAQDIRVLGLLGRHTNAEGWCRRSQVKMAAELGYSRGTVQGALHRLYEAGWVDKRLEGRGAVGPNPNKQPFAAHSYCVLLDGARRSPETPQRNDAADDANEEAGANPELARGASPELARGANFRLAPLEQTPPNYSSELERDARAREAKRRHFAREFRKRWPTAALDDQTKLDKAIEALPDNEIEPCLDGIAPFIDDLKKHGREHSPAGWRFINERRWTLLPPRAAADASSDVHTFKCWSREWWGVLLKRIAQGARVSFMVNYAANNPAGQFSARGNDCLADDMLSKMMSFPTDGAALEAWRPWFERHGARLPVWRERFPVWLPSAAPPNGRNPWRSMRATNPPEAAA
jgi:DNA-binding transcriptional ArsR family regulator